MIAHWDGRTLTIAGVSENDGISEASHIPSEEGQVLPKIPESVPMIETLLWPVEDLLCRSFQLPLNQMRLLDEVVLGQELEDQCGVESDEWWLAWQAAKSGEGLAGIVFGLPERQRQALSEHVLFANCAAMLPDVWVRLQSCLPADVQAAAVLDADEEGIFIGVYRDGAWNGMRRINIADGAPLDDASEDIVRSLKAMGASVDGEVFGRVGEALAAHLLHRFTAWRGELVSLTARAEASIAAAAGVEIDKGPNFRRGTWSPAAAWRGQLGAWRRAAVLAALAALLSVFANLYSLQSLRSQMEEAESAIEAAFHRGLPQESVMLDPIAQLRAAGGNVTDPSSWILLRQLQVLGVVNQEMKTVTVRELSVADGDVSMVGDVPDFAAVDGLRAMLAKELGTEVRIDDTERDGARVRFRMSWS